MKSNSFIYLEIMLKAQLEFIINFCCRQASEGQQYNVNTVRLSGCCMESCNFSAHVLL